jgi:hypothetical protein
VKVPPYKDLVRAVITSTAIEGVHMDEEKLKELRARRFESKKKRQIRQRRKTDVKTEPGRYWCWGSDSDMPLTPKP